MIFKFESRDVFVRLSGINLSCGCTLAPPLLTFVSSYALQVLYETLMPKPGPRQMSIILYDGLLSEVLAR